MKTRRSKDAFDLEFRGERLVVISLPADVGDRLDALTAAERAVVLDACGGLSNAAIARKRKRSARTVANQLASAYRKLGVASRTELVAVIAGSGSTK